MAAIVASHCSKLVRRPAPVVVYKISNMVVFHPLQQIP